MEISNNIAHKLISIEELLLLTSSKILEKLEALDMRVHNLEKLQIQLQSIKSYNLLNLDLIEIKYQDLDIKKEEVLKALAYNDYRSVIYIFRMIYKNKNNTEYVYPIKITGKRSYEYYCNNKWNPDLYGHHIMNTICLNIQNLFIKYCHIDDGDNFDDYILNQNFISKLSEEKYKKEILKSIMEEVRINL